MTDDDDRRSSPAAPASRAARLFLAAAVAVAALGHAATEALDTGRTPEGTGTGTAVSPAPALPPEDCGGSTADFTACGPDAARCERPAPRRGAHGLPPSSDEPLLRTTLCADGGAPDDGP
ncbi:hypothetical protein [Streptomyces roseolus]|uniref:hypothetical protein n=1 Tax=Streptomyces roseolus TaxID=67358 RepID=UPI00167B6352|nr:hypothetical protein [Streptomyces roseolus]GGR62094.1 hypothetical protein GCM10010282_64040 [Streptomyces roseolus]